MAAITTFTYTLLKQRKIDASVSEKQMKFRLQAGDGALTYPTGGIAVDPKMIGLPNFVESLFNHGSAAPDGYLYKYNHTSKKIQIYQQNGSTGPLIEMPNTVTPTIDINILAEGY